MLTCLLLLVYPEDYFNDRVFWVLVSVSISSLPLPIHSSAPRFLSLSPPLHLSPSLTLSTSLPLSSLPPYLLSLPPSPFSLLLTFSLSPISLPLLSLSLSPALLIFSSLFSRVTTTTSSVLTKTALRWARSLPPHTRRTSNAKTPPTHTQPLTGRRE